MKRNKNMPSKWLIVGAMMVFLGTAFISIAMNSEVFGYGLHLNESISHYVGLEPWSAIFFTLGNIFVTAFMGRFLWEMGEFWKMPKIFYFLIVLQAASLLMLSVCPVGMFDPPEGTTSLISWMHIISSRTMFISMMLIAAMVVMCRRANALAHITNIMYVIYAIVCIVGFLTEDAWFMNYVMIYETMYIFCFMLVMAFCDERKGRLHNLQELADTMVRENESRE